MLEILLFSFEKPSIFNFLLGAIILGLSIPTMFHAVIYKRESRAAVGWFALILSSPILGSVLYIFLGINRVERKAKKLSLSQLNELVRTFPSDNLNHRLMAVKKTGESLAYSPACPLPSIEPLDSGDEAYPQMLEAIEKAKKSVNLFSYIFHYDSVGALFFEALLAAKERGVEVRLLVDGVGSQKTIRQVRRLCREHDLAFGIFLPVLWRPGLANLRNHRKILVVDQEIAFTGGLNIAEIYWPEKAKEKQVLDFHFKLTGPVVSYLQAAFTDDWLFATGQEIKFELPTVSPVAEPGAKLARVIVGGPGDKQERLRWHFLSAINSASKNIRLQTPYFLPDLGISTALVSAALRGVQVDVLIPEEGDHSIVTWATRGSMWELLRYGVNLWQLPPPFDHSKLFLVDDDYLSLGSANWDPRSLRLNFELNVEVYAPDTVRNLIGIFEEKKSRSKRYSLQDHEDRPYLVKVRDGFARMFSAYL